MWKGALFAAQSLSAKVVFGQATRIAYSNMFHIISIEIKNLYVGEGRAECVVYNLAHTIRPQLKRNLIKFLIKGLPTRDNVGSFHKPRLKLSTLPPRKGVANSSFGGIFCGWGVFFKWWEGNVFCWMYPAGKKLRMYVVLSQSFLPGKKPLWWVLLCWVCSSQCVQKDWKSP